jgi:ferredoxin
MTYVVTEECIGCKHTDCIEVCPVDCFHEGPNFIAIDPDSCVDCGLCEIECPIGAIASENELTQERRHYLALNRELAAIWPGITQRKDAMAGAGEWASRTDKLIHLVR